MEKANLHESSDAKPIPIKMRFGTNDCRVKTLKLRKFIARASKLWSPQYGEIAVVFIAVSNVTTA
jgi:hypothetical protein